MFTKCSNVYPLINNNCQIARVAVADLLVPIISRGHPALTRGDDDSRQPSARDFCQCKSRSSLTDDEDETTRDPALLSRKRNGP